MQARPPRVTIVADKRFRALSPDKSSMTFPGYTAEDLTTLPAGRMRLCEEPETLTLERRRSGRIAQIRPVTVYEPYASRFFGGQALEVRELRQQDQEQQRGQVDDDRGHRAFARREGTRDPF